MRAIARAADQVTHRDLVAPRLGRVVGRKAGMCEAQRVDFEVACDGKITWQQYFAKLGRGPSL